MDDYIRRQAAIDIVEFECGEWSGLARTIVEAIKSIPAADVVPVVHAYWIPQKENHEFKEVWMKCSACGYPVSRWTGNTNFCPNCGAKMDGGDEHG